MTWLVENWWGVLGLGIIVWASLQASDKNTKKWAARVERVAPIARHVREDIRQVRLDLTFWRARRIMRKKGM